MFSNPFPWLNISLANQSNQLRLNDLVMLLVSGSSFIGYGHAPDDAAAFKHRWASESALSKGKAATAADRIERNLWHLILPFYFGSTSSGVFCPRPLKIIIKDRTARPVLSFAFLSVSTSTSFPTGFLRTSLYSIASLVVP